MLICFFFNNFFVLTIAEWPTEAQINANLYLKRMIEEFNSNDAQDIELYMRIMYETKLMNEENSNDHEKENSNGHEKEK